MPGLDGALGPPASPLPMGDVGLHLFPSSTWSRHASAVACHQPRPLPPQCLLLLAWPSDWTFCDSGPLQLLIGHFLLFQDRSLRPEEIEGETWPLKGKGCSATQETGGREIGGKRGRDGLQGQGLGRSRASSVEPGVRGVCSPGQLCSLVL